MNAPQLVADAPLAHLRWGERGPLVVLLHGIGGGREGWASTGAALAAVGFRALAVDQPGYGLTPAVEPFDLAGMAAAVQRLIDWAGDRSAVVVGHSMGGMVAQELVARAPQAVSALVLAGTSPAFGPSDGEWQRSFRAARFAPLDAGCGMAGLAETLVPSMVAASAEPARVAAAKALMAGVPEATYRRALAALLRFDRRPNLPKIAVPTLVVTGDEDRTASPEVARRMAERIPGAQVRILPATGHLLMLERPAAFDAALLDFLRTL